MKRLLTLLLAAALAFVVLPVGPAVGAPGPGLDVFFDVETTVPAGELGFGPFVASGPAVDEELMCPTGETQDLFTRVNGFLSGQGANLQVFKEFTCDDGTGTFILKLQVRADRNGDKFSWVAVDGTGEYEFLLFGHGHGVGIPCDPDPTEPPDFCVNDLFEGKVKPFPGAAG